MIKICAYSTAYPGIFANDWKKTNIFPIHKKIINIEKKKKNYKHIVSIYRPVSFTDMQ